MMYPIIISFIAFTYSYILTESNKPLYGFYNYLKGSLPKYLFKAVIGCEICVTGQIALWGYPLIKLYEQISGNEMIFTLYGGYNLIEYLFTLMGSMLITNLLMIYGRR